MWETRVSRTLACPYPILLAPMAGVAGGRLAAAVTQAGGFGVIGGGYARDESWLARELDLAGDLSRIGVGFITWSLAQHPRSFEVVLEQRPKAIMLSFGDPAPFAERIKRSGIVLICQVQSVAMARDALAKGADIIIAQGAEAGGHGSSCATLPLVPAVVDAVGDKAPVLAAGGIADGRGLVATLALGAEGVCIGTRFYTTAESLAHPDAKNRILASDGADTARSTLFDLARRNPWPLPFTIRTLTNDFSQTWLGREEQLAAQIETEAARYEAAAEKGNFDIAVVVAGEASGLIHDIPPAAEVVRRIVAEAAHITGGRALTPLR